MVTTIRRYVETDTGHRVPNHKSKCRHFHGHRYRFEAEIEGDVVTEKGVSEEGMLIDFSDVSHILTKYIHDEIDHAFVVYEGDEEGESIGDVRLIIERMSFLSFLQRKLGKVGI